MQPHLAVPTLSGGIGQCFEDVAAQAGSAYHPVNRHAANAGHTQLGRIALQQPSGGQGLAQAVVGHGV